ncbi:MAG: sigma-70 family RNA polymerase sigma factor [Planctomycetes bacterium]|nr:sigma-70 family RNA polymerase sigma factor [Planctomycetota bacterium]
MIKLARCEVQADETQSDWKLAADDGCSDARLMDQARRGDREAFGVLVTRYEKKLQRVLRRMVRDPEQARDLAQDTFLRVYQHLDRFDPSRRFGPWLFRVGVNLAVDWLRRQKPTVQFSQLNRRDASGDNENERGEVEVADPDPRPQIELGQEVHCVLEQIPLNYRTVLVLRDLEGFSCSEVAAIEGRREATIRWRLSRAREMFRRIWEQRQGPEGKL